MKYLTLVLLTISAFTFQSCNKCQDCIDECATCTDGTFSEDVCASDFFDKDEYEAYIAASESAGAVCTEYEESEELCKSDFSSKAEYETAISFMEFDNWVCTEQ